MAGRTGTAGVPAGPSSTSLPRGGRLLEFEAFERWLVGLALESFTIESLCRTVFDKLTDVLGDVPLSVAAEACTTVHAPVTATIERS